MSSFLVPGRVLVAALLVLTGLAGSPSQAQQPPTRDQALEEILKRLDDLRKQVESLKSGGTGQAEAKPSGALPGEWVKTLRWRPIGPANMGGRITAISVFEADPSVYWVATASGGLLKTENNGITFEHQFDKEASVSIGDVCVAPSDKNIVWVGTGENNPRNSVSYGDGVYKSTDGGKTWKNMGLKGSFQTGRVVVHPKDPNTVYVGAMGRLYGPNEERGLYKTTNGGETWSKVLGIDDKTGVIDVAMHPADPETLIVATWERRRDGFDSFPGDPEPPDGYTLYDPVVKWGPGSGLHKTTDGGKTWKKLSKGLPTSALGRVDIDYFRKDPNIVFAVIDCEGLGKGTPPSRLYFGLSGREDEGKKGIAVSRVVEGGPAAKAGVKQGDLILSADGQPVGKFADFIKLPRTKKVGETITLKVSREGKEEEIKVAIEERGYGVPADGSGGGRSFGGRGGSGAATRLLGAFAEDEKGGGIRVSRVFEGRNAAKAGMVDGDLILEAEGKAVADSKALEELLRSRKQGDTVAVKVKRGEETKELKMVLQPLEGGTLTRPYFDSLGGQDANLQEDQGPGGEEYGGVYKSTDGGESWTRINSLNPRPMYFSQIRVDPTDANYVFVLGIDLHRSKDGGKTFSADGADKVHSDHHAMWVDPKDGRHLLLGCDGGVYTTYDRGDHWEHLDHAAIAQFYHVTVDSREPYRVYGGLQDNGSWGGPSRTLDGAGPINADWFTVSFGDGFVCRVDPKDPDLVYTESQDGTIYRRNFRTGEFTGIGPERKPGVKYYFNWNTPFILSSHNSGIFYTAGNYVFRSVKQGDTLKVISPPIGRTGRGTGTALGESPRNADVLWVGTDDGNLFVTKDGGVNWTNVAEKVGLPGPRWVATVEPSRAVEGRCYVAFDGHRSDDDKPYLYVTEDFGQTWKSITSNLPTGSTRCLREDPENPDLLLCGTEFGVWASPDRGATWTSLNGRFPTVAVHELAFHPTAGEVVAATHGRSLWVLDVKPLRQMTAEALKAEAKLYQPQAVTRWRTAPGRDNFGFTGSKYFVGENPSDAAQVYVSLTKKAEKAGLKIIDIQGQTVRELPVPTEPGLHRIEWDLQQEPPAPAPAREGEGAQGGPSAARERRAEGPRGPAPNGKYRVVLTVDGKDQTATLELRNDPALPANAPLPVPLPGAEEEERRERGEVEPDEDGEV